MKNIAYRLAFAQAASGLVGGVATPFFGAWLAWKGLDAAAIGALMSTGVLLRVAVLPLTGIAADARNDRRGMMLQLFVVMLVCYGAFNVVTSGALLFAFAIPGLVAVGAANPLLESVCVRLSARFVFDYGHVRRWASSSFVFGNIVSGLLIWRFGLVIVAPWMAAAAALNLLAVYALPPPPTDHPKLPFIPRMRTTLEEAGELLRSPVFLLFLAAASLDQGSHAVYYTFGGLHWREIGYSGWLIGLLWPLGVLPEIAFMSVSLTLFRRLGPVRLLILGGVACALRWMLLAFDLPLPVVIFAQLLHGGTFALAHLGAMYFILQAVPPRLAATAQSLYAVVSTGLVMGVATDAAAPVFAAYGGRAYLMMAAMGVLSVIFSLHLGRAWRGARLVDDMAHEELATI